MLELEDRRKRHCIGVVPIPCDSVRWRTLHDAQWHQVHRCLLFAHPPTSIPNVVEEETTTSPRGPRIVHVSPILQALGA